MCDSGIPDPQEADIIAHCHVCMGEIYVHEIYGHDGKGAVCIDCAKEQFDDLSDGEKFAALGMDVINDR